MRFIGLDLAWSARNLTGAAVVEGDPAVGRLVASGLLGDDDQVVEFVLEHAGAGPAIVAIDAPLVVRNPTGRRRAEALIGAAFSRYEAGAHPANRARLAVDGVVRGEALVARLEGHRFIHRAEVEAQAPVRQVIEVFPHPAMVSIFNLERTLKYKARPKRSHETRLAGFVALQEHLRSLRDADPALLDADQLLNRDLSSFNRSQMRDYRARLKDYEDRLDAVICAYVGQYLWRWGMARARVFGDMQGGYITTPVPPHLWPTDGP
jgi:predicted RNase H-like nuclease